MATPTKTQTTPEEPGIINVEPTATESPAPVVGNKPASTPEEIKAAREKARQEWLDKRGGTIADQTHVISRRHPELGEKEDGYTYVDVPTYRIEHGQRYTTEEFVAERKYAGWEVVEKPHPAASASIENMTVVMRIPTVVIEDNIDAAVEAIESRIGMSLRANPELQGDEDVTKADMTMRDVPMDQLVAKLPNEPREAPAPLDDEAVALLEQ